ncbi:MAG: transketolase [Deferrisomatales bacterium]
MQIPKGFKEEELSPEQARHLRNLGRLVRGDALRMIHLAGSGYPGGSLSSVDLFVTLLASANLRPDQPEDPKRDRIVVSHGHTAPAFYGALGRFDFFDLDDAVGLFRKAGSIFEGNLERTVPGVEWTSGNLGMGLSVAAGLALAGRLKGLKHNIFLVMSDGEQQKGQVAEARRFIKKYRLNNITALVDANGLQAIGRTSDVMTQNINYEYIADGWDVIEINGHDPAEIYKALRRASQIQSAPVLILAHTTMGSGVSFMEDNADYQGRPLTEEEYQEAMRELRADPDLSEPADYRDAFGDFDLQLEEEMAPVAVPEAGEPLTYEVGREVTTREAFGNALQDVGRRNREGGGGPVAVFDCGTAPAVGTGPFARENRDWFFEFGLEDHAAASAAGAMSTEGVATVWANLGVFGLAGAYNQLRMNDINRAHLKLVVTHLGLDAGEEGKALQCVDALGLADNLFHVRAIFPADPNQTDRAFRYMLAQPGNWLLGLGRSPCPVIADVDGKPFFAGDYEFTYGRVDLVRPGDHGVILTTGQMLWRAVRAWETLRAEKLEPAVIHVACPKALDASEDPTLLQCLRLGRVITYEDHNVHTGLGSRVANIIAARGISCRLLKLGVADYGVSGAPDEVYRKMGLDEGALVTKALKFLKR